MKKDKCEKTITKFSSLSTKQYPMKKNVTDFSVIILRLKTMIYICSITKKILKHNISYTINRQDIFNLYIQASKRKKIRIGYS